MKALVGAFNQEKALVGAFFLRDRTTSPINCLQHYLEVVSTDAVGEVVAVVDVAEVGEPDGVLDVDRVLLRPRDQGSPLPQYQPDKPANAMSDTDKAEKDNHFLIQTENVNVNANHQAVVHCH